ncbi:MAG TPA: hypothetical protein VGO70_01490 [Arsenicitalea sp.]|nr:hypothetical protein [Arsenicitalea sp.]
MHRTLAHLPLLLLISTALVSTLTGLAHADASLTLLDIGAGFSGLTKGVTNNGTIVGTTRYSNVHASATIWDPDGSATLVPSSATDMVYGRAISADGSTITGYWTPSGMNQEAFVFRRGDANATILAGLSAADTLGMGIDAAGTMVVGYSIDTNNIKQAMTWSGPNWTPTVLPQITNLGAGAMAVDADGSTVAGYALVSSSVFHAVYWENGGPMQDIGHGSELSEATGISADGTMIIGFSTDGTNPHPLSFSGPGFATETDLGSLGGTYGTAESTNADGSIIVGYSAVSGTNALHAFRYTNGQMSDLNTLLTNAGVNLGSTVLSEATGISANGLYIAAEGGNLPYLVYYSNGVGGVTDAADQQASVDGLGKQRQGVSIQHDAYAGILTGDLDRQDDSNQVGILGLYGSAVGGVRGHAGLGKGWSLSGGVGDGTSEFGGAGIGNGLYGAVALRYDAQDFAAGSFHPFGQLGGSFGLLNNLSMTRNYVGGTGLGTTNGSVGALYARLGVTRDFAAGDQVSFAGELGERWLSTDAYAEAFSASNPFPAAIAAGTDSQTVAKLSASWTHPLSDRLEVTLRTAVGTTLAGSSGLQVATTGFGTLGTGIDHATWAELGAHASWAISEHAALDLYATSIFGQTTGANAHIGAGYHYKF